MPNKKYQVRVRFVQETSFVDIMAENEQEAGQKALKMHEELFAGTCAEVFEVQEQL